MKCKIPSFVADFVSVESWVADDGEIHSYSTTSNNYVVSQSYEAEADNEYVIRGNSAVMKCEVPSFVADFVVVEMWQDSAGNTYLPGSDYVVHQFYQSRVIDEFVLRGNTATVKCLIPSFVADFVQVVEWITDDGSFSTTPTSDTDYVVNQYYEAQVYDVFVIKGNAAVFKCNVPSFVSDHVEIIGWEDTQGNRYLPPSDYDGKYLVLPSGELHIRDVGPEDGYKSYQCRTKHRLTGETRLSATKGRLVITEPVGGSIPKFPTMDDSRGFKNQLEVQFPNFLLCLKVKDMKLNQKKAMPCCVQHRVSLSQSTEPVGSSIPKFPSVLIIQGYEAKLNDSRALLCPAQGFPVPTQENQEYLFIFLFKVSCNLFEVNFMYMMIILFIKFSFISYAWKPLGSSVPKFASVLKIQGYEAKGGQSLALLCPVQGFPVPLYRNRNSNCNETPNLYLPTPLVRLLNCLLIIAYYENS
ncbi:hypothetical protein C0J52_03159 [Blattella germanica]|nr:hypothetical protein C0J52_03159 [Blattella germanica]